MFFAAICVGGPVIARLVKMPSLVGKIFTGILLVPTLVLFPISFVMLGETGLSLLVTEAGIDIGLTTEATAVDVVVPIVCMGGGGARGRSESRRRDEWAHGAAGASSHRGTGQGSRGA